MKIYLVKNYIPYEADDVISAFKSKDSAKYYILNEIYDNELEGFKVSSDSDCLGGIFEISDKWSDSHYIEEMELN